MVIVMLKRAATWIVGIGLRHHRLHFRDGDHREEANEQQEQGEEEAERANQHGKVNPTRGEVCPAGGQEVLLQRKHNHEAFEPHAHVHTHDHEHHDGDAGAALAEPEQLGRDHVAENHDPVRPGMLTGGPVHEDKPFVGSLRIPRNEEFHGVGVAHNRTRQQNHLVHVFKVTHGDEVLQSPDLAGGDGEGDHHRKAAKDRPGHEIRREDRGVPTGQLADREVKGHHRVDRKDQRGRESSQQQVRPLVAVPVAGRTSPAETEEPVAQRLQLGVGSVPHGGQVGNHAQVPEQQRDGEVGGHRKHIPQQWGAELRPHFHLIGNGEQPVRKPNPTHVDAGKVPAQTTAKMVMASANRLMAVRHFWRKRNKIAEIKVPAWPIPTQNTKFTIGKPHITGFGCPKPRLR